MRSISNLTEGMWAGDLNDLMRSVVSIDEYESKIDDDAIVIGYYVHDIDAAQDLNRFIQKSACKILDAEVSPAPDQKGYYVVFVEIMRNDELPETVFDLTEEISFLSNIDEWRMSVFGTDGIHPLTVDALRAALKKSTKANSERAAVNRKARMKSLRKDIAKLRARIDSAATMLRNSTLSDIKENRGNLVLHDGFSLMEFEVIGVGDEDIIAEHNLDEAPISMEPDDLRKCRKLVVGLGEGWNVAILGECTVLSHCNDDRLILLKEI